MKEIDRSSIGNGKGNSSRSRDTGRLIECRSRHQQRREGEKEREGQEKEKREGERGG